MLKKEIQMIWRDSVRLVHKYLDHCESIRTFDLYLYMQILLVCFLKSNIAQIHISAMLNARDVLLTI